MMFWAWASQHPEFVAFMVGAILNTILAGASAFASDNKYLAFTARLIAAMFPDPAEAKRAFVDLFTKKED